MQRSEATVPVARVRAVRVVEGVFRRPFGLAALTVEVTGYAEEAAAARTLYPLLRVRDVEAFLDEFLPELADDPRGLERPPARAARRYVAAPLLIGAAFAAGVWFDRRRRSAWRCWRLAAAVRRTCAGAPRAGACATVASPCARCCSPAPRSSPPRASASPTRWPRTSSSAAPASPTSRSRSASRPRRASATSTPKRRAPRGRHSKRHLKGRSLPWALGDAEAVEQRVVGAPGAADAHGEVEVDALGRARARSPCGRRCRWP